MHPTGGANIKKYSKAKKHKNTKNMAILLNVGEDKLICDYFKNLILWIPYYIQEP